MLLSLIMWQIQKEAGSRVVDQARRPAAVKVGGKNSIVDWTGKVDWNHHQGEDGTYLMIYLQKGGPH